MSTFESHDFKKFNSLAFDGETMDLWIMETWVDAQKNLFEDLNFSFFFWIEDKMHLTAHCLEK